MYLMIGWFIYSILMPHTYIRGAKIFIWNVKYLYYVCTGKSLSEALIFASTNPQYDDRLFIGLRVQYMKIASSEHAQNMLCT